MATLDRRNDQPEDNNSRPRWQQFIFDDLVLILVLGLVIPTIFYIVLGVLDLTSVPAFQP